MLCVNPRKLPNPAATGVNDAYIQVSCGKCYACLSNRRRSWLFRLQNESLSSIFSSFITLTIDEDHIEDGKVHKKDLQNFFKKLRHHEQFTYYAIGEYGTTTFRPHYHAVLFFKSFPLDGTTDYVQQLCNSLWYKGFVYVSRANYRRLNYILHYHTRPKEPVEGCVTFQLFSKGLGVDFINDDLIFYLQSTKQTTIKDYNGNTYVIPRYYRKKIIDLGYDIDPPCISYNSDNWRKRMIKAFKTDKLYNIPESVKSSFVADVVQKDKDKLKKFNNQDKFI